MIKKLLILCGALFVLCSPANAIEFISPVDGRVVQTAKVTTISGPIVNKSYDDYRKSVEATLGLPGERVLVIDSPGGEVDAGNRILHLIKLEKALGTKITCVASHAAHSMAFNLLTHCNERLAVRGTQMLVHKIRMQLFFFGVVRAKELRRLVEDMERADAPFRRDNSRAMRLTPKEYDRYADAETMWTVSSLLKRGYLHGVLKELPTP